MKKRGSIGYLIALIALLIFITSLTLIIFLPTPLTGNAIYLPTDCSQTEIKATWDSIFKESSNEITVVNNSEEFCEYYAYKINGDEYFMLRGSEFGVKGAHGNSSQDFLNQLQENNISKAPILENKLYTEAKLRHTPLNITQAQNKYDLVFKISQQVSQATDTENSSGRISFFSDELGRINASSANVNSKISLDLYEFIPTIDLTCTPS